MTTPHSPADDLLTVRDWLRYAVSRFNEAKLVYGHGTETALDEAAFMILSTLHLDIDDIDPWLDARLTAAERRTVFHAIDQRVTTRKPASYITGAAYISGHRFHVDERVIVPRSFIGELMVKDLQSVTSAEPWRINRILDLCTGSGCLAILAALEFPNATVDAVDISEDALEVAKINVAEYELEIASALSAPTCSRISAASATTSSFPTRRTSRPMRSRPSRPSTRQSRSWPTSAATTGSTSCAAS